MPFRNYNLTKGGQLVIAQIFSPDYDPGVSGWELAKEGSAEFSNVTVRGLIQGSVFEGTNWLENDEGQFMYSGTPANGNMLLSIAPAAGTDAYGNSYSAGFTVYNGPGQYVLVHVNTTAGAPAIDMVTGAAWQSGGSALYTFLDGSGATQFAQTVLQGPASSLDNLGASIHMSSNYASAGGGIAQGQIVVGGSVTASWDKNGFHVSPPAWTTITMDSGWSAVAGYDAPQYRILPDGNLQLSGSAQHASFTTATALNNSHPISAVPVNAHYYRAGDAHRSGAQLNADGTITAYPVSGGSTQVALDGVVSLT